MKNLINKYNNLDTDEKKVVKAVASLAISFVGRKVMYKKGMVKSMWYGLPRKPHTYR